MRTNVMILSHAVLGLLKIGACACLGLWGRWGDRASMCS